MLDIGAGTGLLALAAAPHVSRVSALDVSPAMCARLHRNLEREGIHNVEVLIGDAMALPLADTSVDAVISNYCFHHLDDDAKRRSLAEIARVLRSGGRLVFADMMFTLDPTDRRNRVVVLSLIKRCSATDPRESCASSRARRESRPVAGSAPPPLIGGAKRSVRRG